MSLLNFISDAVSPLANMVDKLSTSDDERLQARNKLEAIKNKLAVDMQSFQEREIEAKAKVMIAELNQDDNYTKRARPTVLYAGIIIMLINNVVLPWISYFKGLQIPAINLPSEFWLAWGGIASVYSFGRSKEKLLNIKNPLQRSDSVNH